MELIAAAANATGLRLFFGFLLLLVLGAGFYIFRNRKLFSVTKATKATPTLPRMWLVILVWIHAVVITTMMIFEV